MKKNNIYTKKARGKSFAIKISADPPNNHIKPSSNPPGWDDTDMIQYRVTRRYCRRKKVGRLDAAKSRTRYIYKQTKKCQK